MTVGDLWWKLTAFAASWVVACDLRQHAGRRGHARESRAELARGVRAFANALYGERIARRHLSRLTGRLSQGSRYLNRQWPGVWLMGLVTAAAVVPTLGVHGGAALAGVPVPTWCAIVVGTTAGVGVLNVCGRWLAQIWDLEQGAYAYPLTTEAFAKLAGDRETLFGRLTVADVEHVWWEHAATIRRHPESLPVPFVRALVGPGWRAPWHKPTAGTKFIDAVRSKLDERTVRVFDGLFDDFTGTIGELIEVARVIGSCETHELEAAAA